MTKTQLINDIIQTLNNKDNITKEEQEDLLLDTLIFLSSKDQNESKNPLPTMQSKQNNNL